MTLWQNSIWHDSVYEAEVYGVPPCTKKLPQLTFIDACWRFIVSTVSISSPVQLTSHEMKSTSISSFMHYVLRIIYTAECWLFHIGNNAWQCWDITNFVAGVSYRCSHKNRNKWIEISIGNYWTTIKLRMTCDETCVTITSQNQNNDSWSGDLKRMCTVFWDGKGVILVELDKPLTLLKLEFPYSDQRRRLLLTIW